MSDKLRYPGTVPVEPPEGGDGKGPTDDPPDNDGKGPTPAPRI